MQDISSHVKDNLVNKSRATSESKDVLDELVYTLYGLDSTSISQIQKDDEDTVRN